MIPCIWVSSINVTEKPPASILTEQNIYLNQNNTCLKHETPTEGRCTMVASQIKIPDKILKGIFIYL